MRDAGAIIFAHQNAEKRMNASKYKKAREQYNAVLKEGIKKMKARIGDAEFMRDEKKNTLAVMKQIGSPTDYLEESVNMPTVTFTNNLNFTFNEAIKVYHLRNAHTDGDVIVHFPKSNVIHTGDVFFNGKYPYIDLENGGSVKGAMAALQRIISLSDSKTKIIPGHGEVANVAAVKKAMGLLRYLQDAIAFQKASGKTLEQIKAMKDITREYDNQGYGDGYVTTDRMIETVYHGDGKNLKVDVSDRRD
ncbi:MAG: MBL fold metallo-hydrolase, partial [Marinirhabdus sp.]